MEIPDMSENNPVMINVARWLCEKYDELEAKTERRFIKTHFPLHLMPSNALEVGAKIVYVVRNPKDVAVSFYHMQKSLPTFGYTGDFPTFADYFMNDLSWLISFALVNKFSSLIFIHSHLLAILEARSRRLQNATPQERPLHVLRRLSEGHDWLVEEAG